MRLPHVLYYNRKKKERQRRKVLGSLSIVVEKKFAIF